MAVLQVFAVLFAGTVDVMSTTTFTTTQYHPQGSQPVPNNPQPAYGGQPMPTGPSQGRPYLLVPSPTYQEAGTISKHALKLYTRGVHPAP